MAETSALETLLADAQRAQDRGDYHALRTIALEAASLASETGNEHALGLARFFLGFSEMHVGLAASAEAAFDDALALFTRLGARVEAARVQLNLGLLAFDARADIAAAQRIYDEAILEFEQLGRPLGLAVALANSTEVARARGDYATALKRGARAIELFEANGYSWRSASQRITNAHVLSLMRRFDEAIEQMEFTYDAVCASHNRALLALYFEVYALIAAAIDQPSVAAELFGFVDALRRREDIRPAARLMPWIANAQERALTDLGTDAYDLAYDIGAHVGIESMRDRVRRLAETVRAT